MAERVAINPQRLLWCLDELGQGPQDLAKTLNLSEKTVAAALRGDSAFSFRQLGQIASYFGRGVLFFLGSDAVDEQIHTPQFRTIKNKRPDLDVEVRKLIERSEWQREVYLSLLEETKDELEGRTSLPNLAGRTPREAADQVRRSLDLDGRQSIETYREALERSGVLVFRAQGYEGRWHWDKESSLLGFSLYYPQYPVIVLKREDWETRQAFTLMHELGHLVLHQTGSIDGEGDFESREERENEANEFAGQILVPDDLLGSVVGPAPEDPSRYDAWVAPVSRPRGVSAEVVLRRLLDAGRISQNAYQAYRDWRATRPFSENESGGSRQYRHREPLHILGNHYVRTVLGALGARQITLSKASSYLDNLKLDDLHALEHHVAAL